MPTLEVKLSKLFGMSDSPTGKVETEVPGIWRVDIYDDKLGISIGARVRDEDGNDLGYGKLHIGTIGRQPGANFCQNHQFGEFTPEQQAIIVEQVKALHGKASPEPPMELPEDVSGIEWDEESGDDDEE